MMYTRLLVAVLLSMLLFVAVCEAKRFHSPDHGYEITVPDAWAVIPHSELKKIEALVGPNYSGPPIHYDTGFQPDKSGPWFAYPYMLVQVMTNTDLGIDRDLESNDFENIIREISGITANDFDDFIQNDLTSEGSSLIHGASMDALQIDTDAKTFSMPLHLAVEGVGNVQGISIGHMSQNCLVLVHCYCVKSKSEDEMPTLLSVAHTFSFTSGAEVNESSLTAAPSRSFLVRTAIAGGITGGVCALIFGLWRTRKYRNATTNES